MIFISLAFTSARFPLPVECDQCNLHVTYTIHVQDTAYGIDTDVGISSNPDTERHAKTTFILTVHDAGTIYSSERVPAS